MHYGKKLVNPLYYLVCILQLGGDICALEHLGLIYTKYTYDQHGLSLRMYKHLIVKIGLGDIEFVNMRLILALYLVVPKVHQERTLGTEMYLQICKDYIDIFLSPKHDLRSRFVLALKVFLDCGVSSLKTITMQLMETLRNQR